jgi:ribosome maturation factor RimP
VIRAIYNGRYAHFLLGDGDTALCRRWSAAQKPGAVKTGTVNRRGRRDAVNRKEQEIEALLAPVAVQEQCEIWGVEYLAQGRHSKLRIYIDSADGVTVEHCERISRMASDILDVEETLTGAYTLEVSSPGMDRILFKPAQFLASVGERVEVRLNYPFEGTKRVVGTLAGLEDGEVIIQVDDEEFVLPLENVQRARIVPAFD